MINNLFFNLLAAGLILSSPIQAAPWGGKQSADQTHSWKSYTSTKGNYSVDFPTDPEHVKQSIEIPKTDLKIEYSTSISEPNEDAVYVVSVWDYPSEVDMSKPEVNLQDGFKGMLSSLPGAKVESMHMTKFQGHDALEFLVHHEDIYFQGMLLLVDNTLYQVFSVYKEGGEMSKSDFNHFFDSFKLLDVGRKSSKNRKINI